MATPRFRVVPKRTRSLGAEIIEFGKKHGVHLDAWQQDGMDAFSGIVGRARRPTSTTNVLLCPRQNGKSTILILRALFGLFVLRKKMILFSSHSWASSNESFLAMKEIIEANEDLREQVKATRLSAASLGFELHDGRRILFLTRSRAAARGFSGDEIYFDESHFLSQPAHAAIRPTLGGRSAKGNVQTFYAFSAVDQNRHPDGVVASRLRKRGIEGADGFAFIEYSANLADSAGRELLPVEVPAAVCVDPEILMSANPACPERLSMAFLIDEAGVLDVASHSCEHLGVGDWFDEDAAGQTQLDLPRFMELVDVEARPTATSKAGFDVSRDRRRGAVAVAGMDGDHMVVYLDSVHPGVDWIPGRLEELSEADTVLCDSYQAPLADQVQMLSGVTVDLLDRSRVAQACGRFVDAINEGTLLHDGSPAVLDAIKGATVVSVGDAGWAFSRRSSNVDLSPLYACVFALAGVDPDETSDDIMIYVGADLPHVRRPDFYDAPYYEPGPVPLDAAARGITG